jgi:hypothetical protein
MRSPAVVVVQTTQDCVRDELSIRLWIGPLYWLARDSLPNSLVRSGVVEVPPVFLHHPVQMSLAQAQDVVHAFPPHAAQEPFTNRIRLRRPVGCP